MRRKPVKCLGIVAAAALTVKPHVTALAASEEAWQAFRADVEAACRGRASDNYEIGSIRVDPFGSESYGLALITGTERGANGAPVDLICVYDKAERAAEIGGPLPPADSEPEDAEAGRPSEPGPSVATGAFSDVMRESCGKGCAETAERLAPEDLAELENLPAQVDATLDELRHRGGPDDSRTRLLFSLLSNGGLDMDFSQIRSGSYSCEVYWFGFLDQGARRIGTHQCRISREDGTMRIEKHSGERLNGRLYPWFGRIRAFLGRSYLEGHEMTSYDAAVPANAENENFGNKVGLAIANDGTLYIVSIDERGMQPKDPTFFEVIRIGPP